MEKDAAGSGHPFEPSASLDSVFLRANWGVVGRKADIRGFRKASFSVLKCTSIACKCLWKMVFEDHRRFSSQSGKLDAMGIGKITRALV
jgi:hypothetical protein